MSEGRAFTGPDAPLVVLRPPSVQALSNRVLITMPWQKQVSPITALCVSQLIDRRRTAVALHHGDAFVTHSRNSCADSFLESNCEWALTIDDDMVLPFGHAEWFKQNTGFSFPEKFMELNALDRLLSHGKTLIGALYFGRSLKAPPMYGEALNPAEAEFARSGPHDLAKATRWVGTGCMLIHRTVFEDIEKRFPALARKNGKGGQWFTSTEASLQQQVKAVQDFLMGGGNASEAAGMLDAALSLARFENPLSSGEDVSFCLRAKAAGHQPYVDMGLICGHLGQCVYGPRNTGKKDV